MKRISLSLFVFLHLCICAVLHADANDCVGFQTPPEGILFDEGRWIRWPKDGPVIRLPENYPEGVVLVSKGLSVDFKFSPCKDCDKSVKGRGYGENEIYTYADIYKQGVPVAMPVTLKKGGKWKLLHSSRLKSKPSDVGYYLVSQDNAEVVILLKDTDNYERNACRSGGIIFAKILPLYFDKVVESPEL